MKTTYPHPTVSRTLLCAVLFFAGNLVFAQVPALDSEELTFLTLINNYRAQNGAGALQVSVALQHSSQWMSNDMATMNYFSHTDSLGRDPFTRMEAFGYHWYPWGENIAAGAADAQTMFNLWQTNCDPDASGACTYAHRQNMLNPSYVVIGIARAFNANSTYHWYWTTDFGGFLDQTISLNPASPPVIAAFTANPSTITAGQSAILSWSISGAQTVTITGVGDVSTVTSASVSPAQTTTYTLTATGAGGTSTAAATVTVNPPPDTQPPTAPTLVSVLARSPNEVDLSWSASTDNVAVAGYQIVRNGSVLASVAGNVLSYADTNVSPNTLYTYVINAYDAAGNHSSPSNALQVTTPPSISISAPQSFAIVAGASQSAVAGTVFATALQVLVFDASYSPLSGVTVTFTAPSSGPGATFAGGANSATAITNSRGIATAPVLTANNITGTYSVTASVGSLSPLSFVLSNTAVNAPTPSASVSIWPDTSNLVIRSTAPGNPIEVGVKFRSDVDGSITGVRFYKGVLNTGTHTGSLWSSSGTLLATGVFTNESSSGWQTLMFSSPVAISANTTYVASYYSASGAYALTFSYFQGQGADNAPLHALAAGVDGPNGVYINGPGGQFPSNDGYGNNYWVDVLFIPSAGAGTTPARASR
jgi:uncharacterized protein YkwD/chitodextrinase